MLPAQAFTQAFTNVRQRPRLLAHLHRWERLGISKNAPVEWNGKPAPTVLWSFATPVAAVGLKSGARCIVFSTPDQPG